MQHYYCSAFSGLHCYQGLVLYKSIEKTDSSFIMFFVCLDNLAYQILTSLKLEHLIIIQVEQIEEYFPQLRLVKEDRNMGEYAWTVKSSELLYILENYPEVDKIIWLDGDTQMLGDPEAIYNEWGDQSIILTEQYYTGWHESLTITYGRFQAGFIGFRRDETGFDCLKWWQGKCIEWCYSTFEEGKWADQKYLDSIPEMFENTCIVKSLGINMTPFILYRLNFEQQKYLIQNDEGLCIDNINLVLFHYYGYRIINRSSYDLCNYWMKFSDNTIDLVYIPYINACCEAIDEIEQSAPNYGAICSAKDYLVSNFFDLKRKGSSALYDVATIVSIDTIQEALVLYHSLEEHLGSFYWWVCCIDDASLSILNRLAFKNTTVIPIKLITRVEQDKHIAFLDRNCLERIRAEFLFLLLKNNFSIKKILFIGCNYYLLGSIAELYNLLQDCRGFVIAQGTAEKQRKKYDMNLIGLINCYDIREFLQNCIERPKGVFNLQDMILKSEYMHVIDKNDSIACLKDLLSGKPHIKDGKVYVYSKPVKIFHFIDNERLRNGRIQIRRIIKLYLNNELYRLIYEPYNSALNHAMNEIYSVYTGTIP